MRARLLRGGVLGTLFLLVGCFQPTTGPTIAPLEGGEGGAASYELMAPGGVKGKPPGKPKPPKTPKPEPTATPTAEATASPTAAPCGLTLTGSGSASDFTTPATFSFFVNAQQSGAIQENLLAPATGSVSVVHPDYGAFNGEVHYVTDRDWQSSGPTTTIPYGVSAYGQLFDGSYFRLNFDTFNSSTQNSVAMIITAQPYPGFYTHEPTAFGFGGEILEGGATEVMNSPCP